MENALESSRGMLEYISIPLRFCDDLLATLATTAIKESPKSELTAALEAIRSALDNMSGFVVELQHCLASAPARAEFRFGANAYNFSLEEIDILHDTFIYFLHDLKNHLLNLRIYIRRNDRFPLDKDITHDSSAIQWYALRANRMIDWAADVPISVEDLVNEALNLARIPDRLIELSTAGAKGLVKGQFKLALEATLATLGNASGRDAHRMHPLQIDAGLSGNPSERQLQISVTIRNRSDCLEACDAINGTFSPKTESPSFDLYVASRMLLDSGASVFASRTSPQIVIVVPFPEAV